MIQRTIFDHWKILRSGGQVCGRRLLMRCFVGSRCHVQEKKNGHSEEEDPGYITDSSLLYSKVDRSKQRPREERKRMTSHKHQAEVQPLQRQPNPDEIHPINKEEKKSDELIFVVISIFNCFKQTDLEGVEESRRVDEEMIDPIPSASISKNSIWNSFM